MNLRTQLIGVLLIGGAIIFGAYMISRSGASQRFYSRIQHGLTVSQIRELAGRDEDEPDNLKTNAGEFQRSWTFGDGAKITVVFDGTGRSIYKEFGPDFCGVTPLMGKLVSELQKR